MSPGGKASSAHICVVETFCPVELVKSPVVLRYGGWGRFDVAALIYAGFQYDIQQYTFAICYY